MTSGVEAFFRRIVSKGALRLVRSTGAEAVYGDGSEQEIVLRFADPGAEASVAADPALALGEMYMQGRMSFDAGNIFDLLSLLARNGIRKAASLARNGRPWSQIIT